MNTVPISIKKTCSKYSSWKRRIESITFFKKKKKRKNSKKNEKDCSVKTHVTSRGNQILQFLLCRDNQQIMMHQLYHHS